MLLNNATDIKFGSQQVQSVYVGTGLVWSNAPAEWTPTELFGSMTAWFDFSDTGTYTESLGQVSKVNDKGPIGFQLGQGTQAHQPHTYQHQINGLDTLSFDNGTNTLRTYTGHHDSTPDPANFRSLTNLDQNQAVPQESIYLVFENRGLPAATTSTYLSATNSTIPRYLVHGGSPDRLLWRSPGAAQVRYDWNGTSGTRHLLGLTSDRVNNFAEIYDFGTLKGTTVYTGNVQAGNGEFFGGQPNEGSNTNFGEMIVVTGILTTGERQKLEGYLAHKWGLTGGLDVSHPYKTTPPPL